MKNSVIGFVLYLEKGLPEFSGSARFADDCHKIKSAKYDPETGESVYMLEDPITIAEGEEITHITDLIFQ